MAFLCCFVEVAEVCSKPFMVGCATYVLPPLESYFTNIILPRLETCCCNILQVCGGQRLGLTIGQIPIEEQPIIEPIPDAPMKDKHTILAKDLTIQDPKHKQYWELKSDPKDTRFKETKLLKHSSQSWEIKASISFDLLLANKTYGVYLIFKTTDDPEGLNAVLTATVSTEIGDEPKDVCLSLKPKADADRKSGDIQLPVKSSYEEWMELDLGEFYCNNIAIKRGADISIKVKESGKHHIRGVYIAGIELRSKTF